MKIAIIPARGGSKRIPRKNCKLFSGKPMIAWSIEAAKVSDLFDHIIVSTDDDEIKEISLSLGAEVPFTRPAELSDDHTGTTDVIAHGIQWAHKQQWNIESVCCIYATAPFIKAKDIQDSLTLLNSGDWNYSFPVTEFSAPIHRSFTMNKEGGLEMFFPEHFTTRSQDLPQALHDTGQFYWGKPNAWIEKKRIFDEHSIPLKIPRWRVQDIDTEEDWERAELMANLLLRKDKSN